jgi:hypothetical protein
MLLAVEVTCRVMAGGMPTCHSAGVLLRHIVILKYKTKTSSNI